MHLLLIELDGPIADHTRRFEEACKIGQVPGAKSSAYWKQLYDPNWLAQDTLIPGSRELVQFLAAHKWKVVFLTKRSGLRHVYEATSQWLTMHRFDPFLYQLKMKDMRFSHLSLAEWKALLASWYAAEGEPHFAYQRIVLIEPVTRVRTAILDAWNARCLGQELETFASLGDFIQHIALRKHRQEFEPLLQEITPLDQESISITDEDLWLQDNTTEEGYETGTYLPADVRKAFSLEDIPYEEHTTMTESHASLIEEAVQAWQDACAEDAPDAVEEELLPIRRTISVVFPHSEEDPSLRRKPEKKRRQKHKTREYALAHLDTE